MSYAILSLVILVILIFIQRKIVRGGLAGLEQGGRGRVSLKWGEIADLREAVPDEIKAFVKEINCLKVSAWLRMEAL